MDSPCSNNAECKNTEGSFTCECNSGFDGDGFNCIGNGRRVMIIIICAYKIFC